MANFSIRRPRNYANISGPIINLLYLGLVSRLKFQEGIGRVNLFFMETPEIRIKGAGQMNLDTETILNRPVFA